MHVVCRGRKCNAFLPRISPLRLFYARFPVGASTGVAVHRLPFASPPSLRFLVLFRKWTIFETNVLRNDAFFKDKEILFYGLRPSFLCCFSYSCWPVPAGGSRLRRYFRPLWDGCCSVPSLSEWSISSSAGARRKGTERTAGPNATSEPLVPVGRWLRSFPDVGDYCRYSAVGRESESFLKQEVRWIYLLRWR